MTTEDTTTTVSTILTDVETIATEGATAITDIGTAGAWSALCGFFTALPGIISLIQSFMKWINVISGNNPQAFISQLGQVFSQLASAKTQADQDAAAKNLAGLNTKLPT